MTKTVVNGWHSDYCTHETLTYKAKDQSLTLIKREFSDFKEDGYGCIKKTFEGESEETLKLVKTECWKNEVWRQCET